VICPLSDCVVGDAVHFSYLEEWGCRLFSFDHVLDDEVPEEYIEDGDGRCSYDDYAQDDCLHLNIYARVLSFPALG